MQYAAKTLNNRKTNKVNITAFNVADVELLQRVKCKQRYNWCQKILHRQTNKLAWWSTSLHGYTKKRLSKMQHSNLETILCLCQHMVACIDLDKLANYTGHYCSKLMLPLAYLNMQQKSHIVSETWHNFSRLDQDNSLGLPQSNNYICYSWFFNVINSALWPTIKKGDYCYSRPLITVKN